MTSNDIQTYPIDLDTFILSADRALDDFYQHSGQDDLYEALVGYRRALELSSDEHMVADMKIRLSTALKECFLVEDRDCDIKEAIFLADDAVSRGIHRGQRNPRHLRILGEALIAWSSERRLAVGDAIDRALECLQECVAVTEGSQSEEAILCRLQHGIALDARHTIAGVHEDKQAAVIAIQSALSMTPTGHPLRHKVLYQRASMMDRESREGQEQKVILLEETLSLLSKTHLDRPKHLNSLAVSYRGRYETFGQIGDLDKALQATREAMDICPLYFIGVRSLIQGNYYIHLWFRFMHNSHLSDLAELEMGLPMLLDQMPPGYTFRWYYNDLLGRVLCESHAQYGKANLLDVAIDLFKRSLSESPPGHIYAIFGNLSSCYHCRFLAYGYPRDLEEAVVHSRQSQTSAPNESIGAEGFGDLGELLITRFGAYHERVDIDEAISALRSCLEQSWNRKARAGQLHSVLGTAFLLRWTTFRHYLDLDQAIQEQEEAIKLLPTHDVLRPVAYSRLGWAYTNRFEVFQHLEDIHSAVAAVTTAVDLTPVGRSVRAAYMSQLGKTLHILSNFSLQDHDVHSSLDVLRQAADDTASSVLGRFDAAINWASLAHEHNHYREAVAGYGTAVALLPQVAWLGLDHRLRLQRLAVRSSELCQNAAACAITIGKLEEAVEMLERGRSVLWNSSQDLRADMSKLRAVDPRLALEFQEICSALDFQALKCGQPLSSDESSNAREEHEARNHRRLADRWQGLIEAIRNREGFENFLQPLLFSQLRQAANDGTIIILNVSAYRCDALLIREELPPKCIPLPGLMIQDVRQHAYMLKTALQVKKDTRGGQFLEATLLRVLRYLWNTIGAPVWAAINTFGSAGDRPPRVWWCATGALALLPVHACGPFQNGEEGMADLVISSYTPTLSALLRAKLSHKTFDHPLPFKLLAIGLEDVPGRANSHLPSTLLEMDVLRQLDISTQVTFLQNSEATISSVQQLMQTHGWLHMATHGIQRPDSPLESCLLLYDGPLYLSDMAQARLPQAEFAFLSACHSAKGDDTLPDEALHISGALLLAGYKGVLGTQWSIADTYGPAVARIFYRYLTRGNRIPNTSEAAEALYQVTLSMREASIPAWRWVPFVHLGI